jgi:hypothetical protein
VSFEDVDMGYTPPRKIIRPPVAAANLDGSKASMRDESAPHRPLSPYVRLVRSEGLTTREEDE